MHASLSRFTSTGTECNKNKSNITTRTLSQDSTINKRDKKKNFVAVKTKFNLCIFGMCKARARTCCDDLYANEIRNYLFCYSKYIIIIVIKQYSIHLSTNSHFVWICMREKTGEGNRDWKPPWWNMSDFKLLMLIQWKMRVRERARNGDMKQINLMKFSQASNE